VVLGQFNYLARRVSSAGDSRREIDLGFLVGPLHGALPLFLLRSNQGRSQGREDSEEEKGEGRAAEPMRVNRAIFFAPEEFTKLRESFNIRPSTSST